MLASMAHNRNDFGVKLTDYTRDIDSKFHSRQVSGRFQIGWRDFKRPGVKGVMKYLMSGTGSRIPASDELNSCLPVTTWKQSDWPESPTNGIQVTWLGHATVLIQMDGINLLTDPIFSERCSPLPVGPKRYRPAPCQVADLPTIHAVVISHNHYDHLDRATVGQLNQRFGASLVWFVPLGLKQWMVNEGCQSVVELDWWQQGFLMSPLNQRELTFVFTPAQHWSKRGVNDDNQVLWGSWCVLGSRRFFFAGDTGYDESLFNAIGDKFGPFDLAAIPIGAYEPRWFMQCQHIDPEEAFLIHQKIHATKSIGIHWATFNLSAEPYLAPRETIKKLQEGREENFFTVNPGQSRLLFPDTPSDQSERTQPDQSEHTQPDLAPIHQPRPV